MSDTQRHLNSDLEVVVSSAALRHHTGEWARSKEDAGPAPHREGSLWPLVTHRHKCPRHLPGPGCAGHVHLPQLVSASSNPRRQLPLLSPFYRPGN